MNDKVCTRCNNRFYSAYMRGEVACPYCGSMVMVEGKQRAVERALLKKGCIFVAAGEEGRGETIDLSALGAAVRLGHGMRLKERDTVTITIEGLEISSNAEVVWVKPAAGGSNVGLKFLGEVSF